MALKRFIAGAKCPKCGQLDTIQWWQEANKDHVKCVECDFVADEFNKVDEKQGSLKDRIIWLSKDKRS